MCPITANVRSCTKCARHVDTSLTPAEGGDVWGDGRGSGLLTAFDRLGTGWGVSRKT